MHLSVGRYRNKAIDDMKEYLCAITYLYYVTAGMLALTMAELSVASVMFCNSSWWRAALESSEQPPAEKKILSLCYDSEEQSAALSVQPYYLCATGLGLPF